MKTRRLTKKEMWIFAIGQLGWSILSGIVTTWLVTYYLPTESSVKEGALFYVPTGLIIFGALTILGLITFICRIFDAVTDPWIASLSDRSKNPKGRRIPFMKRAAVPFAIVTVLIFFAPLGVKEGEPTSPLNIVWVLVTLILFYLFMTMYCTPYNALISEFGKTQEDRMFISTAISLTFFFGTLLAYLEQRHEEPGQNVPEQGIQEILPFRHCLLDRPDPVPDRAAVLCHGIHEAG